MTKQIPLQQLKINTNRIELLNNISIEKDQKIEDLASQISEYQNQIQQITKKNSDILHFDHLDTIKISFL